MIIGFIMDRIQFGSVVTDREGNEWAPLTHADFDKYLHSIANATFRTGLKDLVDRGWIERVPCTVRQYGRGCKMYRVTPQMLEKYPELSFYTVTGGK
jgi:hypothetical protein